MNNETPPLPAPASCPRERVLAGEARVLEMIARGAPRDESLAVLSRLIEKDTPGVLCCICIFDASGREIEAVVAPGAPSAVLQSVVGLSLESPFLMPCAEVAQSGVPHLVTDLKLDPKWSGTPWAKSMVTHGFRQCRSTPVFHPGGRVCGTFVLLSRHPGEQKLSDSGLSETAAHLASIAITRARDEQLQEENEQRLRLAVEGAGLGVFEWNRKSNHIAWSKHLRHLLGLRGDSGNGLDALVNAVHVGDRGRIQAALEKVAGEGGMFDLEFRTPEEHWLAAKGRGFAMAGGAILHVRGVVADITSRKRAEQELKETGQTLRLAVCAAQLGLWDWNPKSGTGTLDARCRQIFGWEPHTYGDWKKCIHPDDCAAATRVGERALEPGSSGSFANEYRIVRPDGEVRWLAGFGSVVFDSDGQAIRVIGANLDITRQKQSEKAAAESAARFQFLAESLQQKIFTSEPSGVTGYLNPQWAAYTGRSVSEVLRVGWHHFVHPDDRSNTLSLWQAALETGRAFETEHRFRRADGTYRWHLSRAEPFFSNEGTFAGFIGGCVDIHDQKELEARLRESEGRSRLAVEAAGMGFWDWSGGGVIKWSPEHNRILGIPPERVDGTFEDFLEHVHPADRPGVRDAFRRTLTERVDFKAEFRTCSESDDMRWVAGHGRAFFDRDTGEPRRMLGVVRDITDRRQSEERIRQNQEDLRRALAEAELAREHAEEASRAKDRFLAILSHELRTPLTPVLMAVSTFKNDPELPEKVRSAMEMIQRNVKVEARLIDDLLDLTRITRNRLEFIQEPMDLAAAARQALDICRPEVEAKSLRLESNLETLACPVLGDFARLQQVFWNLIKNAIKFTDDGGLLRIHASKVGDRVRVAVRDSGIGIDPAILPAIFKPFEQGNAAVGRQFGGLGLGLAISQATIEAHDGVLTAESGGVGCGATFTVELSCGSGATLRQETRAK